MSTYITPKYKTINNVQKNQLTSLISSTLINGFTEDDFQDILKVLERVVNRLEIQEQKEHDLHDSN